MNYIKINGCVHNMAHISCVQPHYKYGFEIGTTGSDAFVPDPCISQEAATKVLASFWQATQNGDESFDFDYEIQWHIDTPEREAKRAKEQAEWESSRAEADALEKSKVDAYIAKYGHHPNDATPFTEGS